MTEQEHNLSVRSRIRIIIFEADSPTSKLFDELLILSIILSIIAVMLDSIHAIHTEYGQLLYYAEWGFTVIFTLEYLLRLSTIGKPLRYARSFFGIVDILAILPSYLALFFAGSQYLMVVRVLRVLRVFRILKLAKYLGEAELLMTAMRASRRKITVFLMTVLTLVVIIGSLMYVIEGEENGFTSIPRSMYWAIVTLTTVGYGDVSPKTNLGQFCASIVMILGYAIIAVPTGIVSAEIAQASKPKLSTRLCPYCNDNQHEEDAAFCKTCGRSLAD